MSVFAVIEPKEEYNRQNEAAFREEVRSLGNSSYDKRGNLTVPIGKKLQFTSPTGVVVTLGFDGGNFTIQQNTSTPFSLASISYVTTIENGLASRTSALETTVNTPVTGLTARITAEEQTRAGADSALALRASNLEASVDNPATGLLARATSLETRVTTVETGKASTTVTDTIDAKIENPTTGLKARASSLESRVTSVETGKASTSVTDAIDAKIEDPTTGLKARATSVEGRVSTVENNKAEASTVTSLTARVASGDATGLIRNSRFAEPLVAGLPPGWSNWANGTGTAVARWVHTGGNAFRLVGPVNAGGGLQASSFPTNSIRGGSRFRVLIEAVLVSGTYDGSGVFIDWRTAGGVALTPDVRIGLANTADTSATVSNSAAGFRSWDVEVTAPATAAYANFYVMSHWSNHAGGQAVANSIDWHLVDLVPVSNRLASAEANITNLQTTTSDLGLNKAEASTVSTLSTQVGNLQTYASSELPSNFEQDGLFWTDSAGGAPATRAAPTGGSYRTITGVGRVRVQSGFQTLCPKGVIPAIPNSVWELEIRARVTVDSTLTGGNKELAVASSWNALNADYSTNSFVTAVVVAGSQATRTPFRQVDGWQTFRVRYTVPASPAFAFVRPRWYVGFDAGGNGDAEVETQTYLISRVTSQAAIEANITNLQTTTSNLNLNKAEASTVTTLSSRVSAAAGGMDQVEDFAADGLHWTTNFGGSPGTIADAANGATYVDVAGIGRCLQINTYPFYLTPKAAFKPAAGRRYRLTVRASAGADATDGTLTVAINNVNGLNAAWAHGVPSAVAYAVPGVSASANVTVAEGFKTISREWALPGNLGTFDAAWRLRIDVTRSGALATGGTVLIADFRVEDVTDVLAAAARGAAAEGSGLVKNSLFQVPFSGSQIPPDWNSFANGTGTLEDRTSGTGKAYRLVSIAGLQSGNQQSIPDGSLKPGRYTLRAKLRRVAGTLDGAAVYILFRNTANTDLQAFSFPLATTANTAGETRTDPDGITTWELPVTAPANTSRGVIYFMNHFTPAGSIALTNTIDWHEVDLFPVTNADVRVAAAEANITNLQTTTSNSTSAIASLQTLLTSRVGQKPASLLVNPAFSDYPVASASIPPGWANWGNGLSSSRGAGRVGTYAHIQEGVAAQNAGLYQNRRMEPGKHNIDIAIERSAGTLTGGGVLIQYFNSSSTYISETQFPFASISDTRGGVGVSVGYDYRTFRLAFTAPANTYTANVYLMNHWDVFGNISTYNQIYWHQVDVTPVDYGSATVDALATTVATVDGKLSASYGLTVDAGGRIASMKLLSDGTTSSVKFTASTFQIYNGTTDVPMFEVVGGAAYVAGSKVRTESMTDSAVTSDKINAGAVTASKISVTSLDAITATIGLLRTATSGARTEIESNVIRVYDSSNTLRVRMGIWT